MVELKIKPEGSVVVLIMKNNRKAIPGVAARDIGGTTTGRLVELGGRIELRDREVRHRIWRRRRLLVTRDFHVEGLSALINDLVGGDVVGAIVAADMGQAGRIARQPCTITRVVVVAPPATR